MYLINFTILIAIIASAKYYQHEDLTKVTLQDIGALLFFGIILILEQLEAIKKKIIS